jgi:hypothetical protein
MRNFTTFSLVEGYNISTALAERYGFKKKPKKAKARAKGGGGMAPPFLLLLLVLLAPVTAQAGVAEQSLTHANAKVRAAVLHDVCEVHGNEPARRRGPRGLRLNSQGAATFTRY